MGIILICWFIFAVASAYAAGTKGRSKFGWFLGGLFFGIFAFGVLLLLPPKHRCPWCRNAIHRDAVVCGHCHYSVAQGPVGNTPPLPPAWH